MKISQKITTMVLTAVVLAFGSAGAALAHIVVKPSDARTGEYQTFSVNVPTEKNVPTVGIKLDVPKDLIYVTPTLKPGWTITTAKQGEGETATVSSITWTGGEIDAGYRDEFTFSAKLPDHAMDLTWKAYQTYKDGSVVSWNQQPVAGEDADKEGATTGPFSVTKVADDSDQDTAIKAADSKAGNAQMAAQTALYTAIGAGVLALIAVVMALMSKTKNKATVL